MATAITLFSAGNSAISFLQNQLYGARIANTEIEEPPIFIVGHWRSGTTYLHELLVQDERFVSPTTYECFAPNHFLLSEWFFTRYLQFLMPSKRPADNVAIGWEKPQEDEFALCNLGAKSPYLRMAFPNHPPVNMEYLDMQGISEEELEQWKSCFLKFVRLVTFYRKKRLVLKSPPHTGRIQILSEMFPGARFIHIVRDPYSLFPSTVRLWNSLDEVQGLQLSKNEGMREYVFQCFERMYQGFEKQRLTIDPQMICDIRYEDLVQDPVGQLREVYTKLGLGGFEAMQPKLAQFAQSQQGYQTNRHQLDEATRQEITRRWGSYLEKYGYSSHSIA